MPSITRKVCVKHGIYTSKVCELCKKNNAKEYNSISRNQDSVKIYNSREWKDTRVIALVRDGYKCVKCKSKFNLVVDHIVELVDKGKPFDLDNLQTLCKKCHAVKTEEEKKKRF